MCGIFGIVSDKKFDAKQILEGIKTLEYRGYDSWGLTVVDNHKLETDRRVGKIGDAKTDLPATNLGIGHTRWATHGGVTRLNTHPHLDCNRRIAVVHNGIVENYQQLKTAFLKKSHRFASNTDTEIIAHLIEMELDNKDDFRQAFTKTFLKLEGSNSVVALDLISGQIALCRNGPPLIIGIGRDANYVGSDVTPFLKYTRRVIVLEDNQGAILSANKISVFNIKTGRQIKSRIELLTLKETAITKGDFPHFLIKEIYDQKKTIILQSVINKTELVKIAKMIRDCHHLVITGCGSAAICALAAKYLFAAKAISIETYGAYEASPFAKFVGNKTIFIAISQSGETADTLLAVKAAKKRGAHTIALVNNQSSTLSRLADDTISISAGPEIAVVSTKTFTAQLAFLNLLAGAVSNTADAKLLELKRLNLAINQWLSPSLNRKIHKIASRTATQRNLYIIGKNIGYAGALEIALKIKEVSYIHAEAFASGELKHGPIALIEPGTICICLISNDVDSKEVFLSCAELKSRGAIIIGISPFQSDEFDYHIQVPDLGDLTIIPQVVIGQLLGYYCSIELGYDPDKPRNLAKSVTVK